ncbi:hypothetical protein ES708_33859 [subsurface metagenome]
MVIIAGLIVASIIPFPNAKIKVPMYNIQYPLANNVITNELIWQINAIAIAQPYPILSIIRLKRTMDNANGHRPTPMISPIWVLVRLNSTPHSEISIARSMNPNDVAINATKQA